MYSFTFDYFEYLIYSGTSDLFATCCYQDIRVWHLPSSKELLRISVPNMTCNAIEFTKDGRSIVSGKIGWIDGFYHYK